MASSVLLYFLALAATATFAQALKTTSFGTYRDTAGFSFYKMPLTTNAASKDGWAQVVSTNLTTIWCWEEDPRVCMLYDSQGTVAGMQISFRVADIIFPGNDSVDNHSLLFINNMYNTELYSARFYLVDQGRHYFYNMSKEMPCEDLLPYFLLVNDKFNSLHGLGLRMIGRPSIKSRKWFDVIPGRYIKDVTQDAPACLYKLAKEYGIFVFYVYFVANPYSIVCSTNN